MIELIAKCLEVNLGVLILDLFVLLISVFFIFFLLLVHLDIFNLIIGGHNTGYQLFDVREVNVEAILLIIGEPHSVKSGSCSCCVIDVDVFIVSDPAHSASSN